MDNSNTIRRVSCPMESVSATFQSLDTVRALHQTVVSLRSALEEAKNEIQRLRCLISVQSDIKEGAKLQAQVEKHQAKIEKSQTSIESIPIENDPVVTESRELVEQASQINSENIQTLQIVKLSKEANSDPDISVDDRLSDITQKSISKRIETHPKISFIPDISITTHPRTDKDMTSKIDVKIKVMSNIKVEIPCSETSSGSQPDSARSSKGDDNLNNDFEEESEKLSEDNLCDTKEDGGSKEGAASLKKDIVTVKDDNSASDSENSVFFEDKSNRGTAITEEKGSEKGQELKEEVDDIELIFSSGENREPIQEDLVSISEYDPWQNVGTSGTPVLVKFSSLRSDPEESASKNKITVSTSHDVFFDQNLSQQKSVESMDSSDQRSTKSSSLERDTSDDRKEDDLHSMGRGESIDYFDQRDTTIGRKWTNYNVLVETDISKCGIIEETAYEMYRRNTCPNPPAYRPLMQRESIITTRHISSKFGTKYCRRYSQGLGASTQSPKTIAPEKGGTKRSSAAQTEISALPDHWKSESQLLTDEQFRIGGPCTLPSKFAPTIVTGECLKHSVRNSDRTQEARRVLLSDINFTSMVPELSRSADHLCPDKGVQNMSKQSTRYYKGNHLKTPDYALKGMTPSVSMNSPGESQWTVNENSFGTQTIQTGESWGKRGDSFDSCRSYSVDSKYSGLDRYHRSRSAPSIRCAICKLSHGIRTSESMHYTPRVTFQEPACKIRGSLPDLRHDCMCSRRYPGRSIFTIHGDSSGSTESLLDEADTFVRKSMESANLLGDVTAKRSNPRRMSENDIQKDYTPSKQSLPFLPKTAKCLKPGHLAKVISKNGRVVVGRVRYVGPLATFDKCGGVKIIDDLYVGVQLESKCGDCDGTFEGRKFFDCEPLQGLFVPFKKVVMAWTG